MRYYVPLLLLSSFVAAAPCSPKIEHRKIDQRAIQDIQKNKVNTAKDMWRLDAPTVAAREAAALDASYKGIPEKASVKQITGNDKMQVFSYMAADGSKSYEITLKKYEWLIPYSGIWKMMMWTVSDVKTICPRK